MATEPDLIPEYKQMPGPQDFTFRDFFDAVSDEIVILDATGTIVAFNTAWQTFCSENGGDTDTYYLGSNYMATCCNPDGESGTETTLIPKAIREVLATGSTFRCEYPCHSPTEKRWFELTASRLMQGDAPFAVIQHRNISIRKRELHDADQAYVNSEILSSLVAASNDAILSYDLDGNITTWNRAAEKLYGYSPEEMIGQSLEKLYPPDWPKRITQYRDEILAGKLTSFEAERIGKDGRRHTVWVTGALIRDRDGTPVMISNIHRDITEVRRAEEARNIIAHEVIHRAKNMLAVVGAIHRQTSRTATTLDEFNQKFGARIQSLSTSTDLLVSGNWTTVALADLVHSQVRPFIEASATKLSIDGAPVVLRPEAVQVIGMALHELSTNSAKHGALKFDTGKIDIRWAIDTAGADPNLLFQWNETGMPPVAPRGSKGFGNTVLTALAQSMLNATADFSLSDTGVDWSLKIPGTHFSPGSLN